MKNRQKSILENKKLLARFLRQVYAVHDSPSLIRLVANERDYMVLCGAIANSSPDNAPEFFRELESQCSYQGLDVSMIQKKLRPVALSLGLAISSKLQTNYYDVLRIPFDADTNRIKKAYRELAHKTHPDTSSKGRKSSQAFVELNAAYHTLIDPDLRHQYDQSRNSLGLWKESEDKRYSTHRLNTRHIYQFGGLLVFLVLVAFVSSFIFQQKTIIDDPYTDIQTDIERPEIQNEKDGINKKSGTDVYMGGTENSGEDKPGTIKKDEISMGAMKFKLYKPALVKKYMADLSESRKRPADDEPEIHKRADKAVEESEVVKSEGSKDKIQNIPVMNNQPKQDMKPDSKIIESGPVIIERVPASVNEKEEARQIEAHNPIKMPQPDQETKFETQQVESASLAKETEPEEKLDERIRSFLRIYCQAYEDKNLPGFAGFFTPDATELGEPFHKFLPKYKENFEEIDSIRYRIRLEQYSSTGDAEVIRIAGRFSLEWLRHGGFWQNSRGTISMSLLEVNGSFLVKSLDYSFKE